jgi:hypothetical protein
MANANDALKRLKDAIAPEREIIQEEARRIH